MNRRFFPFIFREGGDDSDMPETQSFWIKYDGEAFSEHTIDVNDLAPALLALPTLVHEANRIANKDESKISIKVKAPKAGSFQIVFWIVKEATEHPVDFFNSPTVSALTNATSLLWWGTASGIGLLAFIRWMRGRKAKRATLIDDSFIEIETESETIRIPKTVWELYQSPRIRAAFYQILKPLEKPGVDKVEFKEPEGRSAEVKKDDVQFYLPPPAQIEPLPEMPIREPYVNVVHMWFRGENKWKFSEGDNEWTAEIKDQKFLDEIRTGHRVINANDFLKVRVKQIQFREGSTIHSTYDIIEVLEHKKAYREIDLL